jgi:ankyrin repeat protein
MSNPAVSILLQKGASVTASNEDGRTPLYKSIEAGDVATVRLLLSKGARVDTTDIVSLSSPPPSPRLMLLCY